MTPTSAVRCAEPVRAARRPRSRELVFAGCLVLLVAGVTEGLAALASTLLVARGAMADVPVLSEDEIALALARRSPRLGWGPATDARGQVVVPAPRADPAFPSDRLPCIAIYGDSFTLGAADDATYPHDLALALGCPVANHGVGGYGSDQSLMLFEAQRAVDRAPVVVLAHLSENVMRNVNQYQRLLYPASRIRFKPRFLLDGGDLRWLPIPVQDAADYRAVADDPARFLAHDAFVDRPRPRFPYTVQLLRWLATDSYVRARVRGRPWHAGFYAADHSSGALPLTVRILSRFAEEARADGRTPVVFLLPMRSDLAWAQRTGRWADQPLVDALAAAAIPFVDAGPGVLARLGDRELDGLFAVDGHPNADGYAVLAAALEDGLARLGLPAVAERARRAPP
jgi:hypothetical protein